MMLRRRAAWLPLLAGLFLAACVAKGEPAALAEPSGTPSSPVPGAAGIGDPYYPGLGNGGYDVRHYDITLEVDMESGLIEAVCAVRAVAEHGLSQFNLDLYALDVDAVHVNGVEAEFDHDERELVIQPAEPIAAGAEFVTAVVYGGVPEVAPDPATEVMGIPGVGWWRMGTGVYTLSECVGAASWFPCNDHPLDKATFTITVTAPKPYVVAANGIRVEEKDHGEARTYVFEASDPMATYLATVNIAEFEVIREEGPHGIPLTTYHPVGATEQELSAFERTPEMLTFFEECFGPYPFESYGAVISYETLGGALETQTLPVYSRGLPEPVVAHEMAHQWFGNCVSPASWSEMWLNEGFANYAEWLWFERNRGSEALQGRARRTYQRLRHGRKDGPPFDPGVQNLFTGRVYVRGSWVLHSLRERVGDETFFEILRGWVAAHHDGNASTADFTAHCEQVSGQDLDEFFQGVLYDEVVPEVPELEAALQEAATEDGQ